MSARCAYSSLETIAGALSDSLCCTVPCLDVHRCVVHHYPATQGMYRVMLASHHCSLACTCHCEMFHCITRSPSLPLFPPFTLCHPPFLPPPPPPLLVSPIHIPFSLTLSLSVYLSPSLSLSLSSPPPSNSSSGSIFRLVIVRSASERSVELRSECGGI